MNISSEISALDSNASHFFFNGTEAKTDLEMLSFIYMFSILMSLPTHSYVIWLIVTGTGNGLASEFFILKLSVCEILLCFETLLNALSNTFQISSIGLGFFDGALIIGYPSFECLICVERYLAVVHPVIFLRYKPLRYRLMCSAVIWMTTFVAGAFNVVIWLFYFSLYYVYWLVLLFIFLSIQLFCCQAVLRALKQSGPGERGREREEENHMKKRAFHLILIATVSTVFKYATLLVILFVPTTENEFKIKMCFARFCFILAGLVQPVFFLYRVGKLDFIKCQ